MHQIDGYCEDSEVETLQPPFSALSCQIPGTTKLMLAHEWQNDDDNEETLDPSAMPPGMHLLISSFL
jgi:hypothetical protein